MYVEAFYSLKSYSNVAPCHVLNLQLASYGIQRVALSCLKQDGLTLMAEQAQALKLLFEGRDVFIWFPTGYGKSLCYISCYPF